MPGTVELSAGRSNAGSARRGKVLSAAPYVPWARCRLLHDPSTVRRPNDSIGSAIWSGPVPTIDWQ